MERKEAIMKSLNITEAEADELLEFDKRIDRGERTEYDLDPEKEEEAKKLANVTTHKTSKTRSKPKRAENPTKREIIAKIESALQGYDNITVENVERIVAFSVGTDNFTITLTQKRK